MKEGLIKDTYEAIIKELQTIISISYIFAVGIGMLFNFQKFSEFGINIFDYADIFDFLIAPFSDFKILFFTIINLILFYSLFKLDILWKEKYPKTYSRASFGWDKKVWYNKFRYISFFIGFVLYLYLSADYYGKITMEKIKQQPAISLRFDDNEVVKGIMIGKTKEIIFLLKEEKVIAVPITSLVKDFEIK